MRVDAVLSAFSKMQRPIEPDSLAIQPLAGNAKLAVGSDGGLALFFELPVDSSESTKQISKSIDVMASQEFRVWQHGESTSKPMAGVVVMLRESDLNWYFAAIVSHVASVLAADPRGFATYEALDRHLSKWLELFAVERLNVERAIGLWGELAIVLKFKNIDRGIAAWAGPLGEPFDFVANDVRLELKTSIMKSTVWFSLKQLIGRDDGYAMHIRTLRDAANGRSLQALVALIRSRVEDDTEFLYRLGSAGYRFTDHSELRLTLEDARVVSLRDVPRPVVSDARIGSVRFEVDFDSLSPHFIAADALLSRLS